MQKDEKRWKWVILANPQTADWPEDQTSCMSLRTYWAAPSAAINFNKTKEHVDKLFNCTKVRHLPINSEYYLQASSLCLSRIETKNAHLFSVLRLQLAACNLQLACFLHHKVLPWSRIFVAKQRSLQIWSRIFVGMQKSLLSERLLHTVIQQPRCHMEIFLL